MPLGPVDILFAGHEAYLIDMTAAAVATADVKSSLLSLVEWLVEWIVGFFSVTLFPSLEGTVSSCWWRTGPVWYLSVNSPELIFDLVNAKPGTNHSTNPTNPNGNSKR